VGKGMVIGRSVRVAVPGAGLLRVPPQDPLTLLAVAALEPPPNDRTSGGGSISGG
jgi:hypothetical protein